MIKKLIKKATAFLMVTVMLFSMLPNFKLTANAAETNAGPVSVGTATESDLKSLGLDTSTDSFSSKLSDSASAPFGNESTSLLTFNELAFSESTSGSDYVGHYAGIYDADTGGDATSDGLHFGNTVDALDSAQETQLNTNDVNAEAQQSKAFDPTGSGKDDYVATVYATAAGSDTGLKLKVAHITDNANEATCGLGCLYFSLESYQANAYLPIAVGDFDGDGKDEIAVYRTAMDGHTGNQYISIMKYDADSKSIQDVKDYCLQNLGSGFTGDSSIFDPYSADTSEKWKNQYYWPVASLCTVQQKGDSCDDLVMSVSPAKMGTDRANAYTRVLFWVDPLAAGAKLSNPENMTFNWSGTYGKSDSLGSSEIMMFGGAGAADVDGDGYNDVVLAGYRQFIPDEYYRSNDWSLNEDWYMAVRFTYDQDTKSYSMVGSAPQYININDDTYHDDINMNETVHNGDNGDDQDEIVKDPLDVVGFAEEGKGYADSVFINGFVVRWGTTAPTQIPDSGLSNNDSAMSVQEAVSKMGSQGYFYVKYAVPVNQIIAPEGHKTLDGDTGMYYGWIADAAAGNFDENLEGKQELFFTYAAEDQDGKISYDVVGVKQKSDGDVTPNFTSEKFDRSQPSANTHLFLSTLAVSKSTEHPAYSLYACDTDDDSTIIRYSNQPKEFYFSNPHVISVLQSAPYFNELDTYNNNYSSSGSTSITRTSGSSSSTSQGFNVTSGIIVGFEQDINVIINIGSVSATATLSTSLGSEFENSTSVSKSVTFTAVSGQDEVALTMTPYIRYHYQLWSTKLQQWVDTDIDVPEQPRTTEISVDTYDRVAQNAGWQTIRGNLINDAPGDPGSYASSSDGLNKWSSGSVVGSGDAQSGASGFVGVGSGTGTISEEIESEKSSSASVNWGVDVENETEINLFGIITGQTNSLSYFGGYTKEDFSGHTYQGTVSVVPDQAATDYDFSWCFGSWEGSLNNIPCLVLGYLVQGVKCPPKVPADFRISDSDQNSVSLAWNRTGTPDSYEIYRQEDDRYFLLAAVDGSVTSYVDTACDPDTEYTYEIRSCGYVNNVVSYSAYSGSISGYTNPGNDSGAPIFTAQPENAEVRSGATAVFRVSVTSGSGGNPVRYQWQTYSDSDGWDDITGANESSCSIANVTNDQNGVLYRCAVSQMVGNRFFSVVSRPATLEVGKGATSTGVNAAGAGQVFSEIPLTAAVTEKFSGADTITPSGNVTFTIKNTGDGSTQTVSENIQNDWTSVYGWYPQAVGNYIITAVYNGSSRLETSSGTFGPISVTPRSIFFVVQQPQNYQYTGSEIKPNNFSVYDNGKTLQNGTDYTLSYSDCKNVGTVTINVTGVGNYQSSTGSTQFSIVPRMTTFKVQQPQNYQYTGNEIKPADFQVYDDQNNLLQNGTDYTLSYSDCKNVGTVTINVTGAGNYQGSTGSTQFSIVPRMTTFKVQQPQNYQYTGDEIKPADFQVYDDQNNLLQNGTDYTLSYSDCKNAGTVTITVTGAGNYQGSTGSTQFQIVRIPLWLNLSADPQTNANAGSNIKLTATVPNAVGQPQGTITFKQGDTIIAQNIPISTAGDGSKNYCAVFIWNNVPENTYDLAAEYVPCENDNYSYSPTAPGNDTNAVIRGYSVNKQNQTGFSFADGTNYVIKDGAVTLTYGVTDIILKAAGGSGTGAISYASSDPMIAAVNPNTGAVDAKTTGTVIVTATKEGDDNYNAASAAVTININKADQTGFGFAGGTISKTYGDDEFTVSAAGGQSTGKVTYASSDPNIASVDAVSGTVTIKGSGSVTMTAVKEGNGNYNAATAAVTININKADQTGFGFAGGTVSKTYGDDEFTVPAAGGQSTGKVTYTSSDPAIASVDASSGTVTMLKTGGVTITAVKAGDGNYNAASAAVTININKADQTGFGFAGDTISKTYSDDEFTVSAAGGQSTGKVTYASGDPAIASVDANSGTVTMLKTGSVTITAVKEGDGNYNATAAAVTLDINKADQTGFGFAGDTISKTYGDDEFTVSAAGGQSTGKVTYASSDQNIASVDAVSGTVTIKKSGSVTIKATKTDDEYYKEAQANIMVNIGKAAVSIISMPAASLLTSACKLSSVTLSEGEGSVAGDFVWTDPGTVVSDSGQYPVTFIPAESENYSICTGMVTVTVASASYTDSNSGVSFNLSAATLPAGVTSVSVRATALTPQGPDAAITAAVKRQFSIQVKSASGVALYNVQMIDQNGKPIEPSGGKVTVRIPIPESLNGDLHVYWYNTEDGTVTDMNATQDNGYLVFETTHFSYYAVSKIGESSSSSTLSNPADNPETGDENAHTNVLWMMLAVIAASFIIVDSQFLRTKNRLR